VILVLRQIVIEVNSVMKLNSRQKALNNLRFGDYFRTALVVAHHEDTSDLCRALRSEGFDVTIIKRHYSDQEIGLPRAIKCLLNHSSAWKFVCELGEPALIVEADFVPCKGIASFPMPYCPKELGPKVAYVYAAGPVVYHADGSGGFFGHAATNVAYTVDLKAAGLWLDLLQDHQVTRDFNQYYQWDVEMPVDLRRLKGVRLYLSQKDYGEHGGIPNPEHRMNGITHWHQAAALMSPLAFLPQYAKGSWIRFVYFRVRSRARYVYKFIVGKYFDNWGRFVSLKPDRPQKLWFAFRRTFL